MAGLKAPAWESLFLPEVSLAESFLRGTLIYFGVLILFRIVLKRQTGGIGLSDIMLVVLVSECVSNALSAQSTSIPNGLVAVLTLLFWSFAVDWASYHWPWLRRQLEPQPLELVRNGKKIEENLRREQITDEELAEQLRQNGVEDVSRVKLAVMESNGCVSVIRNENEEKPLASPPEREPAGLDAAMKQFLQAAKVLRAAVEEHEARAAEHRRAAREVRKVLSRHGVQGKKFLEALAEEPPPADHQVEAVRQLLTR